MLLDPPLSGSWEDSRRMLHKGERYRAGGLTEALWHKFGNPEKGYELWGGTKKENPNYTHDTLNLVLWQFLAPAFNSYTGARGKIARVLCIPVDDLQSQRQEATPFAKSTLLSPFHYRMPCSLPPFFPPITYAHHVCYSRLPGSSQIDSGGCVPIIPSDCYTPAAPAPGM